MPGTTTIGETPGAERGPADGPNRAAGLQTLQVKIGGMSCSFCVSTIEKAVGRLPGVEQVGVSLAHEETLVRFDPERLHPDQIRHTIRDIGYTVRDPRKVQAFEEQEAELEHGLLRLLLAASFTITALLLMGAGWLTGQGMGRYAVPMLLLALATMFGPGWQIKTKAWASVRRGILNQHVLLELAAFGGLAGGTIGFFDRHFPAAGFLTVATFVTTYHLLSGYVSLLVRTQASQSVRRLMQLQPDTARVVRDGKEMEMPVAEVQAGDIVTIRPGERVPVDGVVVSGSSAIDQSLVTGEPMPEDKREGDEVIGGSVNQTGALTVRATRVGEESFLAQVIRYVEEARALKPGILQLVDQVIRFFVPGVLITAAVALLGWLAGTWLVTGTPDVSQATYVTLAVLVMGYPCALGMATPLAMIRGGGFAAEKGILLRSAEAFQVMGQIRRVLLDKTGTITQGKPRLASLQPGEGISEEEILTLAAAVEASSEHPLGRAIVDAALARDLDLPEVGGFESITGVGVRASLNGSTLAVVKPGSVAEQGISLDGFSQTVAELESAGSTVVLALRNGRPLGLLAIQDTVKPDAAEAVGRFRAAGIEPVLITGDNERAARVVAAQVGIEQLFADVLPQDKAEKVRELQRQGYRVMMVGDGINDAPALMQADVGVAMGAGTDIAIESADIIIVGGRLLAAAETVDIGRDSFRKTKQNISLAFVFNGVGLPLAAVGLLPPAWAMVAMLASVTTILTNSFANRHFLTSLLRALRLSPAE
ncbi:MAG: cation-translocating P-type ATPase [Chloroflexota bacterium]|nr:cation-translocating P-type ATPase [Chloroflexota bacterium]